MDQRQAFVWECSQDWFSMTDLCERYGISRKTGYKWLTRYRNNEGVTERSRRPHSCEHAIPERLVQRILALRRAHPRWGPKKLVHALGTQNPTVAWPARSTISLILKRHGLSAPRRRRRRPGHPGPPVTVMDAPNAVWAIDYKGQFRTGDGAMCYPLTITDGYSRFLLGCEAFGTPSALETRRALERAFRTYGLPTVLRSDNGAPFAGTGLARLSRLSVWCIRYGVRPELIQLAAPQQNGRHERMHRVLKQETATPPAPSRRAQARRFARFRQYYNYERPHEGIGQAYPGSLYVTSPRRFPSAPPPIEYPARYEVRRVYDSGEIYWGGQRLWLSEVLGGEDIGLSEVADGYWTLAFGPVTIGVLDERRRQVRPAALLATITGGARVLAHARADQKSD
jgi:transposase InsO family protein